jgi:hypothetical protein
VHAATGEPPLPKPAAPAAVGRAVLIVDDNEDAARMLGDSLSGSWCVTTTMYIKLFMCVILNPCLRR